jgi:uncharacterized Zn-binding protein involved in type VI secretion
MARQSARITDPTVHLAVVATGSPDTFVGMLPAARLGDGTACPLHVVGRISKASTTVFINGVGAARQADQIACTVPPTPMPGGPATGGGAPAGNGGGPAVGTKPAEPGDPGGPPMGVSAVGKEGYKYTDGQHYEKTLYADFQRLDSNYDKQTDGFKVGAGMASIQGRNDNATGGGARGQMDVMSANATVSHARENTWYGGQGGTVIDGKASMESMSGSVYKGPAGDNGYNPYVEGGAGLDIFAASAHGESLIGSDGRRVGLYGKAGAGASAVTGSAKTRFGIPLWGDKTIDIKVGAAGDLGAVGAGAGGGAYYDKVEGRFHVLANFAVKVLAGLGLDIDISVGKKFQSSYPPQQPNGPSNQAPTSTSASGSSPGGGGPDMIALGCPTVYIGG